MDLTAIGQQFGLNEAQTRAALEALTPVVAAGVRRSAQTPAGLQDIFRTVLTGGHDASLSDVSAVSYDRAKPAGDEILGQIFGNKDVSRGVAQQLSATSGIGAAILKQLLPIVASLVIGKLAKGFGGGSAQASPSGGGLGGIIKDILGGGSATPQMPDPAPSPTPTGQSGGSLEDMLNDILKGGKGGVVTKQIPPGQMGDILKEIFGGQVPGLPGGQQRQAPSDAAVTRGRKTLDDALGGGTRGGSDADILLDGVDKAVRRGG
jgi:hypothetical protein